MSGRMTTAGDIERRARAEVERRAARAEAAAIMPGIVAEAEDQQHGRDAPDDHAARALDLLRRGRNLQRKREERGLGAPQVDGRRIGRSAARSTARSPA